MKVPGNEAPLIPNEINPEDLIRQRIGARGLQAGDYGDIGRVVLVKDTRLIGEHPSIYWGN